jgi:hypothetical protein
MTLGWRDSRWLRSGLAAVLVAAWVYCLLQWREHPQGATASIVGLIGFAALGLAALIAPFAGRAVRIVARVVGWVIFLGALSLDTVLIVMLRNGL